MAGTLYIGSNERHVISLPCVVVDVSIGAFNAPFNTLQQVLTTPLKAFKRP